MEKLLKKSFESFILAVLFLVPLIFSPFFTRVFEIPKTFIFYSGTLAAFLALFLYSLTQARSKFSVYKGTAKYFLFSASALFIIILLSTIVAKNPTFSFFGSYERLQGFLTIIHYFVFAALLFAYLGMGEKNYAKVLLILLSSAALISLYAVLQRLGFDLIGWDDDHLLKRVFSTLSSPMALAHYLVMIIPISLAAFFAYRCKILIGIILVMEVIALFFSEGRAAFFALILALIPFFYFLAKLKQKKFIFRLPFLLFILVLSGFLTINLFKNTSFVASTPLSQRLIVNEENNRSLLVRFSLWETSFPLALKSPFLGHGAESFQLIYPPFKNIELNYLENFSDYADRSHNEFLDILLNFGFLALICYVILFGLAFFMAYEFIKKTKDYQKSMLAIGLLSSLIAYLFSAFFGFSLLTHFLLLSTILVLIWQFNNSFFSPEKKYLKLTVNKKTFLIITVCLLFISYILVSKIYSPLIRSDFLHKKALTNLVANDYEKLALGLIDLENAAEISLLSYPYAVQFASVITNLLDQEKIDQIFLNKKIAIAKKLLETAEEKTPDLSSIYLTRGNLLGKIAAKDLNPKELNSTIWNFRKALELDPKNPDIYLQFGNIFYENMKFSSAIEKYEQFLSMIPKYWQWQNKILDKKEEDLKRIFLKLHPAFDQVLINLGRSYASIGNFEKAIFYLDFASNDNFEKHLVLGDIYKFADKIDLAEKAYKNALEYSPDNPAILKAIQQLYLKQKK